MATGETAAVASIIQSGNDQYKLQLDVTNHYALALPKQISATNQQTNAILVRCRGQDAYNQAIYNSLGDAYVTLPTGTNEGTGSWDIVNAPNASAINIRQGFYKIRGVHNGETKPQRLSGLYEVLDNAIQSLPQPTDSEISKNITEVSLAVNNIARNSITQADGDPSCYSAPRPYNEELASITEQRILINNNNQTSMLQSAINSIQGGGGGTGLSLILSSDSALSFEDFVPSHWIPNPSTEISISNETSRLEINHNARGAEQFFNLNYEQNTNFRRAIRNDDFTYM